MITLLKAFVAGIISLLFLVLVCCIAIFAFLFIQSRPAEGVAFAWDPVSLFRNNAWYWLLLVAFFAVGFFWQIERERH